jgi:uroporphyrinogen III methyltransferase/synthase
MKKSKVYLVGVGPMNEKLVTLRALECIREADVILYDRLINDILLKYAKRDAKIIFVGKSKDNRFPQQKINQLMLAYAKKGVVVARLKGGDPFLLGRGAEEALVLAKAGVNFEIVNGVSSSFAAPAFAGIPLTARGVSSAVTIVTGQEYLGKDSSCIDWSRVFSPNHTLVILMGLSNLGRLMERLKDEGAPKSTPVAVIYQATTPWQRVVVGNLDNIVGKVNKAGLLPPCVVVVGKVVTLRKKLEWLGRRILPLKGKHILIVSTKTSFYRIRPQLEEKGAKVSLLEGVKVLPLKDYRRLDHTISEIKRYQWLVFTSRNAVRFFLERIERVGRDIRALGNLKIATIGPGTAEELGSFLIKPDLVPKDFSSQGLVDAIGSLRSNNKRRILLLRADRASPYLPSTLRRKGLEVKELGVYRLRVRKLSSKVLQDILSHKIDVIVFTSSLNAKTFFESVCKFKLRQRLKRTKLVCLGRPTQAVLKRFGFSASVPEKYTFPYLVRSVVNR